MSEKSSQSYVVLILRRDGLHIEAITTESFSEAKKLWESLEEQWVACLKKEKPFKLTSPIVTAFDPGLVSEIRIMPIPTKNADNPYEKKMNKEGFSNTFSNLTGAEVLDRGYKS